MKVYVKNAQYKYQFPEDMERILTYLNENGELFVDGFTVEKLYEKFSDECYCAGWITVDHYTLSEFADWLEKYDL